MTAITDIKTSGKIPIWRDERFLRAATQIVSAAIILGLIYWAISNFLLITQQRGMPLTYGFLKEPAGFPIAESYIPYEPTMSFGRAFQVGLVNTLVVSITGVFFATWLGLFVGLARLSTNWLVNKIALAFIEFHRNIPLLVLLFLWYFGVFAKLPPVKESLVLPGPLYVSQRGLYLAWPRLSESGYIFIVFLVIGIAVSLVVFNTLRSIRIKTGQTTHYGPIGLGLLFLIPAIGWFVSGGYPFWIDVPVLQGFNYKGGLRLSPEFAALTVGLTTYTAAFIAEVFRSGIQAVQKGQVEAARALGLRAPQVLNLVVIPQALRVVIPPLISQYLNLAKNSSLALTIGYQEIFAIGKVTINQAGRAVPVFLMVMGTYLAISLITSVIMNIYNRRVQFIER
jgi:general L-amino acid transport system permease protein